MAAFGISFPKLTLCRSVTSKSDTNNVQSSSSSPTPRALSLSIKNVSSQPLQYDVSTIAIEKKKVPSMTTLLAIDGETKQMPKKLSVFTELQLDENKNKNNQTQSNDSQANRESICLSSNLNSYNTKTKSEQNLDASFVISSLSLKAKNDHCSSVKVPSKLDSNCIVHDIKDDKKTKLHEHQSNHTFTPPTSSVSEQSSSTDLHRILSSISVELPPLNYAIEKFLEQTDDCLYEQIQELKMSSLTLNDTNRPIQAQISHVSTDGLNETQFVSVDNPFIYNRRNLDQVYPSDSTIFKKMKWYVSELKINHPLLYRTSSVDRCQLNRLIHSRKFSHSFDDLNHMFHFHSPTLHLQKRTDRESGETTYSTSSLPKSIHSIKENPQEFTSRTSLDSHILCKNDPLHHQDGSAIDDNNDDHDHLWQLPIQRTVDRITDKDNMLIRNESVKKKLFDILNDDELENACLEDMSQEFERISLVQDNQHTYQHSNSFSSSDDDARYSSPANEMFGQMLNNSVPFSVSYDENLSSEFKKTMERDGERSRFIGSSLDEIPLINNPYDLSSSLGKQKRPSWFTSPSPQWHNDEQNLLQPLTSEQSFTVHLNSEEFTRTKRLPTTSTNEYLVKGHPCIEKNLHHQNNRKDQTTIACGLINDSNMVFPVMQDKSSNLLMFI